MSARAALLTALALGPTGLAAQAPAPDPGSYVYEAKIEETRDHVFILSNGAVVEVATYVGYVGYRKDAVLFFIGAGCRLWIEGKRVYRCSLSRNPAAQARKTSAALVLIQRISNSGDVLVLDDGSVFEVSYQGYLTSIWLPGEAILMDDSRVIHLDSSDEVVDVVRLR